MDGDELALELLREIKSACKRWFILFIITLVLLLSTIRKMLSELYMTCDLDENEIFKKHLETLQNITQPNII